MKRFCCVAVLTAALALLPPTAMAKDQAVPDGVQVDEMSPLRKLMPAQQLEAQALQGPAWV